MVKIEKYAEDVSCVSNLSLDWEMLRGKTVLISGASGLIGTFLIDVLMEKKIGIRIVALGRDEEQAKIRFERYWDRPEFLFVKGDINKALELEMLTQVDYVIHAASNTHPLMYSSDPIGTLMTNLTGTKNLLDVAVQKKCKRFVFLVQCGNIWRKQRRC